MNVREYIESKTFKKVLIGIVIVVIALFIFQAGVFIGYRKASFSFGWGERYFETFGGPGGRVFPGGSFRQGMFTDAYGATGEIIKIQLPVFIVLGNDGIEKEIVVTDDTVIHRFREKVDTSALTRGDLVVVIGEPNAQSQIESRLVRIMPSPDGVFKSSASTSPQR